MHSSKYERRVHDFNSDPVGLLLTLAVAGGVMPVTIVAVQEMTFFTAEEVASCKQLPKQKRAGREEQTTDPIPI